MSDKFNSLKSGDYDMEGFMRENPGFMPGPGQHYPDKFKLPGHITFSNESKYSTPDTQGGQWTMLPDGRWTFTPSQFNLQQHSPQELQDYFNKYESGNILLLPRR